MGRQHVRGGPWLAVLGLVMVACWPASARAQAVAEPAAQEPALTAITTTPCGNQAAAPRALPPAGSAPFIWILEPCFPKQGNSSTIESETYMYWIKVRPSTPSQGIFVPFTDGT